MKKQDKRRKERRVLIAALFTAGVITAGSTFAWFTSKDEVTNRLSASASYNVSIAEDFQPTDDWIPGQTVNKDVSAVNTGNVDAFVRMWLEGEMSIMKKVALDEATAVPAVAEHLSFAEVAAGDKMAEMGFKFKDGDNYYKVLSTDKRKNPDAPQDSQSENDDNNPAIFSEVQSVQAGGYLVSAPAGAVWKYTAEQQTTLVNAAGETVTAAKGKTIGTEGSGADVIVSGAPCAIDSDTFTPVTGGLYIFRRYISMDPNENEEDAYGYSGYVFDGVETYFALTNDENDSRSDYVLPAGAVTVETSSEPQGEPLTYSIDNDKIKLFTATETVVPNNELTWSFVAAAGEEPAKLIATYDCGNNTGENPVTADDIKIEIALANLGRSGQTWTRIEGDADNGIMDTFYYSDDVEAGDTTAKLVDSVKLSGDTTQEAFLAFDFDLNVFLDSIQVTLDEAGNEGFDAVKGGWAAADGSSAAAASATETVGAPEINTISWE